MGGMDRVATLINAVRAERGEDKVLLLDGGDTWQGCWTSTADQGPGHGRLLSALKLDAMVGHWEFTYGAERVKEIADKLAFPFLAQNIRDNEWQEPVFPRRTRCSSGAARRSR